MNRLESAAQGASRVEASSFDLHEDNGPARKCLMGDQKLRKIALPGGRTLRATPVFDTYWRFAAARQDVFFRRLSGAPGPWTADAIIASHRFTNAYRASDRVSQYLLRHVLYEGDQSVDEVFFRCLLFKLFNRVDTWTLLKERFGFPSWSAFDLEKYSGVLDAAMAQDTRLYSAAYIMPSPPFGHARKHRNHLELLSRMMRDELPSKVLGAPSLKAVFELLRSYPSLGDFLAFQFAIDLNYSAILNFSEMEFVVAGPGARNGIQKCFADTDGLAEADVIAAVTDIADVEFERLGLRFNRLGRRPLQLIDCQNLFCETDKYARVAHPEYSGESGRTRIKQKFAPNRAPLPQFYPPKWRVSVDEPLVARTVRSGQTAFTWSTLAE